MFNCVKLEDNYKEFVVDITGKRYSDFGMKWDELSKLTGIDRSILEMYDDWYVLDDGLYYFKVRRKFEELFMSELAHECRVRCVDFLLALDKTDWGIMSKLYRDKKKQYYMYSDFCKKYFNCVKNDLGFFRLASVIEFGEEKTQELMNDIFGLMSLDMFTGQLDREEYNLFFECSDDSIRVAPLCDNGEVLYKNFHYSFPLGEFSLVNFDDNIYGNDFLFLLETEKVLFDKLVLLLNIDIKEILKRTIDKYKIVMNVNDKKQILSYFDDRKKVIEYTLRLSKNSNR